MSTSELRYICIPLSLKRSFHYLARKCERVCIELLCFALSFSLVFMPAFSLHAQDGIDIKSGATMGTASGGIPVLNIAPPSQGGVSHNKFNDFNVGEQGLIVNNQNMRDYSPDSTSVLSGQHVEFNRNLPNNSARIILNEVVGDNKSQLKGFTEIYGQKADYILANPNGIYASGAGFINVGRLSLIAGNPNMVNGEIRDFTLKPGGIIKVEGVGEQHFGLSTTASKAELVADLINIAGNLNVSGELELLTGNDKYDYASGKVSSNGASNASVAVDSSALGGMRAGSIRIHASQTGLGVNVDSTLIADTSGIEITADGNISFKDAATKGSLLVAGGADVSTGMNASIYADAVNIEARGKLENKAELVSNSSIKAKAAEISNIGKLIAQNDATYVANDVNNYGQFYTGGDITFNLSNDFINYRDSAVLSGGDIDFNVGRNLVNYRAEIFALGDIRFNGQDDVLSALSDEEKAFDTSADMAALYDNPYVVDQAPLGTYTGEDQQTDHENSEEDDGYEFYLDDLQMLLVLPADAFGDDDAPGTTYTQGEFTVILGVQAKDENGELILDEEGKIVYVMPSTEKESPDPSLPEGENEPEIELAVVLPFTILDNNSDPVLFSVLEDEAEIEDEGPQLGGTGGAPIQNDNFDKFLSNDPYIAKSDAMNALVNVGGRIEAFGSIGINSDRLLNMGADFNTGKDAASIYYHQIRGQAGSNDGWQELGRNKISETHLDSQPAYILAGRSMGIHSRSVLNRSANLSSGGNMSIAAEELTNQTSNELFQLAITLQKRKKWKNWYGKTKRSTSWQTQYYNERVYSRTPGLITSLGDLLINSTSIFNDQTESTSGFRFGRKPGSDVLGGAVGAKFNLPTGPNGIFKMSDADSKYLVESNTGLLNPAWYTGAEYLFANIRHDTESRKLLGDPAYETRVIMDTLRNSTAGRYLDGDQVLSDSERMQALYNGSIEEHARLGLQVGLALSAEQVGELTRDIIWYVEDTINGQKVLVPQLYLCPTTLAALASDNFGAKITGKNVEIISEYVSNSGDIFAENLLSMKADTLINESNWMNQASIKGGAVALIEAGSLHNSGGAIGGGATQISADNLINETKVYTETLRKDITQRAGHTGSIFGDNGLKIDASGIVYNRGANIESANGDVYLSAGNVMFDTVELYNRTVREHSSRGFLSKKKKVTIDESLTNIGSNLMAAGKVKISTTGDASFRGSTITSNDAIFDIGGNFTASAAHDQVSHYSKTSKSSWGGLVKEIDILKTNKTMLNASVVNTLDGLNIISGQNTNIIGSNINAGGDANILAGYRMTENGLEKSGLGGSVNVINDFEAIKSYSYHEKTDIRQALGAAVGAVFAPGLAFVGVATGDIDISFERGKFSASMEIGKKEAETWDIDQKNVVGSNINVGGNLTVGAADDVNIVASNVMSGGDTLFDATNINLLSADDSKDTKHITESTKVMATANVGNAYADTAYAIHDVVKATEALKKAKEELSEMKKLRDQGKANTAAVKDAELNLAMAVANEANAIIALGLAAAGSAAAASSGMGTGLYASAGLGYETTKTEEKTNAKTNVGSNVVSAGDIIFNASGDMAQIGSNVMSEEASVYYKIGQDLLIAAAENVSTSSSKTSSESASVSVGNNGVASANVSASKSKSSSTDVWYNNSTTTAENGSIHYDVGGDFKADGYNALAKDIDVNVGGDFTLASKQNSSTSSGSNRSINAGASSSGSVNGGFSTGKHSGDRDWVDNRSTLVGTESVNVNVDGTLHLAGSTIANITKDGADGGNLNISAGDITWEDLQNREKNKSSGMSFQTGISLGGKKADDTKKQADAKPEPQSGNKKNASGQFLSDSSTIGVSKSGSEREGVSYATLGSGNISTGSGRDLAGLNRDINNADVISKDMITGALDGSVTIDHRLLSEEGRKEIANQVGNLDKNLADSAIGAAQGTANLGKVVYDSAKELGSGLFGDGTLSHVPGNIYMNIGEMQAAHEMRKRYPSLVEALYAEGVDPELKNEAWQTYHSLKRIYGATNSNSDLRLYADENDTYTKFGVEYFRKGSFNPFDGDTIGLNLSNQYGEMRGGDDLISTLGHEGAESIFGDHNRALKAGEFASDNASWANWLTGIGGGSSGSVSTVDWMNAYGNNSQFIRDNNAYYQARSGNITKNDSFMTVNEYMEFYEGNGNVALRVPYTTALLAGMFDGAIAPLVSNIDSSFFAHWVASAGDFEVTDELSRDLQYHYKINKRIGTVISVIKLFR